jgi:hypothetical protein
MDAVTPAVEEGRIGSGDDDDEMAAALVGNEEEDTVSEVKSRVVEVVRF